MGMCRDVGSENHLQATPSPSGTQTTVQKEDGSIITFPFERPSRAPFLECPFGLLQCDEQFEMEEEEAWISHSFTHFFHTAANSTVPSSHFENMLFLRCYILQSEQRIFLDTAAEAYCRPPSYWADFPECHTGSETSYLSAVS